MSEQFTSLDRADIQALTQKGRRERALALRAALRFAFHSAFRADRNAGSDSAIKTTSAVAA